MPWQPAGNIRGPAGVVSASAPLTYNETTKALALSMGSGSGLSADTLRGLTDAQFARRYTVDPGSSEGRKYVRIATLDGVGATAGAGGVIVLSGTGASGNAEKAFHLLHVGQRNTAFTLRVWSWNTALVSLPPTFHSRQISTYVYEVWVYTADYTKTHEAIPLVRAGLTMAMDSVSTTAPSGLSAAVTQVDMSAGGPVGPEGPQGPQGVAGVLVLATGTPVPGDTPAGTLVAYY